MGSWRCSGNDVKDCLDVSGEAWGRMPTDPILLRFDSAFGCGAVNSPTPHLYICDIVHKRTPGGVCLQPLPTAASLPTVYTNRHENMSSEMGATHSPSSFSK